MTRQWSKTEAARRPLRPSPSHSSRLNLKKGAANHHDHKNRTNRVLRHQARKNSHPQFPISRSKLPLLAAPLLFGLAAGLSLCAAQVPPVLSYQGRVQANGSNFTGAGQFKLAIVDGGVNINETATARASVSAGGQITDIAVLDGGSGYASVPQVRITDPMGGGRGATAVATLLNGSVRSIQVTAGGSNYQRFPLPLVRVDPPPAIIVYTTYWSHDGSSTNGSEPTSALNVSVQDGLFVVRPGDTSMANMDALPADVFTNANLYLRIWFNDGAGGFARLSPDHRLTTAPYAFFAGQAANLPDGASQTFTGPVTFSPASGPPFAVGSSNTVVNLNADLLDGLSSGAFWQITGNAGTVAGRNALGTTDSQPLDLMAAGRRGWRLEYASRPYGEEPMISYRRTVNLLGGYSSNNVSADILGATIAGGGFGSYNNFSSDPTLHANRVTGDFGTVGGGYDNVAGTDATVPGGSGNSATGEGSLAAGRQAAALSSGSFVWSDGTARTTSGGANRFVVRATGGVRLYTDGSIYSDSPKGISLTNLDGPMITREWDKFSSSAPPDKAGLGRWGLFMEPLHLVAGIPDADAGDRAFAVWAYQTDGSHK